MTIELLNKEDEGYEEVAEFLSERSSQFNYEELSTVYNSARVGAILNFIYLGSTISNFKKTLNKSGLIKEEDYEFRVSQAKAKDKEFRVAFKKLTEKTYNY